MRGFGSVSLERFGGSEPRLRPAGSREITMSTDSGRDGRGNRLTVVAVAVGKRLSRACSVFDPKMIGGFVVA